MEGLEWISKETIEWWDEYKMTLSCLNTLNTIKSETS